MSNMQQTTGYVYANDLLQYRFSNDHPFNQMRLKLTTELLLDLGSLTPDHIIPPRIATDEELSLIHTYDYIQAIRRASHGILNGQEAKKYGLDGDDTLQFRHMHQHSARIVGGALNLADAIMNGTVNNGCHLGGGLHHSLPGRANGFCIYNDVAITIAYLIKHYNQRVLCIDTDAHHGDGTQWSFYTENKALIYSIHETGKFLFPGSGHYTERGNEQGFGYTVNIPLEPYTEDNAYLDVFKQTIEPIVASFKPDIIVSVHGVDIHYLDPLTHMSCTLDTLYQIPYIIKSLADTYTNGRVMMFGGGGYNIWKVVPRAWTHVFLALIDKAPPQGALPSQWLDKWQPYATCKLPKYWHDDKENYINIPREKEITATNLKHAQQVMSWFK
ncbi:acetoin utilization protein AcuC [Staphylococcus sp. GSSP0090]|nr:acetoin utilization protein AcuC [Staphylococcus sp. GSSP0090]